MQGRLSILRPSVWTQQLARLQLFISCPGLVQLPAVWSAMSAVCDNGVVGVGGACAAGGPTA